MGDLTRPLAFIAILLVAMPLLAEELVPTSAGALARECENSGDFGARGVSYCFGFMVGALRTVIVFEELLNKNTICMPTNVSSDQIIKIFVKYLHNHPEKMHLDAEFVLAESVRQAFPCQKPLPR